MNSKTNAKKANKTVIACRALLTILVILVLLHSQEFLVYATDSEPPTATRSGSGSGGGSGGSSGGGGLSGGPFMQSLSSAMDALWSGAEPQPPSTPWYQAKPEDIQTCKLWGGRDSPVIEGGSSITGDISLAQLTLTIQADKSLLPDNTTLYQVSWYVEPFQGSVSYSVTLVAANGKTNALVPGSSAGTGGGAAEFFPFYSTENYVKAVLDVKGSEPGTTGTLTVPFVEQVVYTAPAQEDCIPTGKVSCKQGKCTRIEECKTTASVAK